jgi:hypothetical protein
MIFGSDNFGSIIHKFVRNTEVGICIDRAAPGTIAYEIIKAMRDKLVETKEITASTLLI